MLPYSGSFSSPSSDHFSSSVLVTMPFPLMGHNYCNHSEHRTHFSSQCLCLAPQSLLTTSTVESSVMFRNAHMLTYLTVLPHKLLCKKVFPNLTIRPNFKRAEQQKVKPQTKHNFLKKFWTHALKRKMHSNLSTEETHISIMYLVNQCFFLQLDFVSVKLLRLSKVQPEPNSQHREKNPTYRNKYCRSSNKEMPPNCN